MQSQEAKKMINLICRLLIAITFTVTLFAASKSLGVAAEFVDKIKDTTSISLELFGTITDDADFIDVIESAISLTNIASILAVVSVVISIINFKDTSLAISVCRTLSLICVTIGSFISYGMLNAFYDYVKLVKGTVNESDIANTMDLLNGVIAGDSTISKVDAAIGIYELNVIAIIASGIILLILTVTSIISVVKTIKEK